MRHVKVSALIAMAFISFLSANATATAGCCGTWDGRGRGVGVAARGLELVWRFDVARGRLGAPVWGYQTLLSPASDTDSRGVGLAYRTDVLTLTCTLLKTSSASGFQSSKCPASNQANGFGEGVEGYLICSIPGSGNAQRYFNLRQRREQSQTNVLAACSAAPNFCDLIPEEAKWTGLDPALVDAGE